MIRFLDGPAEGVALHLRRLVFFLRVVRSADGKWDALDQPDDTPAAGDTVYVYWHHKTDGHAFVDGVDKQGRRCGWTETIATYGLHAVQPDDATLRDTAAWAKWCHAQPEAERYKAKSAGASDG